MPRISLAGFKDPVRRPRYIIWTGVCVIAIVAFLVLAIGVSSSRWFCGGFCHQVQGDDIKSYENSSHSEISCLACHMPVNSDPVTFLIHKAEAGIGGVIGITTNDFEKPVNPESTIAMDTKVMPERQCTQCHSSNRRVTPHKGILIDHAVHASKGITCTMCHNRIAHNEKGVTLTKGREPHEDFMKMEGCYRCHALPGSKPTLPFTAPDRLVAFCEKDRSETTDWCGASVPDVAVQTTAVASSLTSSRPPKPPISAHASTKLSPVSSPSCNWST